MVLGGDIYYSNDGQIESREVTKVHRRYYFLPMNIIRYGDRVVSTGLAVTSMHFHIFVSRLVHILITNS